MVLYMDGICIFVRRLRVGYLVLVNTRVRTSLRLTHKAGDGLPLPYCRLRERHKHRHRCFQGLVVTPTPLRHEGAVAKQATEPWYILMVTEFPTVSVNSSAHT
jgi:hypothetical protein